MLCLDRSLINDDSTPSCPPQCPVPVPVPVLSPSPSLCDLRSIYFHLSHCQMVIKTSLTGRGKFFFSLRNNSLEIYYLLYLSLSPSLSLSRLQAAIVIITRGSVASIWKSFACRKASLAGFAQTADTRPRDETVISARRVSIRTPQSL